MFTDEALCLGVGSSLEKIFITFSSAVCRDSPAFTRLLDLDEATFLRSPVGYWFDNRVRCATCCVLLRKI